MGGGGRRSEEGERREGGLKAGRYIGVGSSPVCVFQCIQYYSLIFHNYSCKRLNFHIHPAYTKHNYVPAMSSYVHTSSLKYQ